MADHLACNSKAVAATSAKVLSEGFRHVAAFPSVNAMQSEAACCEAGQPANRRHAGISFAAERLVCAPLARTCRCRQACCAWKRMEGGREGRKKEAQRSAGVRAIAAAALLLMLLAWM